MKGVMEVILRECERHKLYDYACSEGYSMHTDYRDIG
jgi:hypothetical protein